MPTWMRSSVKRLDYPVYRNLWEIIIIEDAIRNLHVGIPKDYFDLPAMKTFLRKKYGVPVYGKTKK